MRPKTSSAIPAQAIFMGMLAAFVGFASSFTVVLQGLRGVGASEAQAASGLMAAAIAMGLCGIVLSMRTKIPVSVAWSTPGAALLATSATIDGGFNTAVGAFILCSGLVILSGLWRPFGRAVAAIPDSLANAMLAGILLSLCLAPFRAIAHDAALGIPILLAWIIGSRLNRFLGVPFALAAFVAVIVFGVDMPSDWMSKVGGAVIPQPVLVVPNFTLEGFFSIALPLFIVTMASQNIPGLAVLRANGYDTSSGPLISVTGIFGVLSAPFGNHATNLAAITAAMLSGEEAGPDPDKRYIGALVCGVGYIVFGLFAGAVTAFISLAPVVLIEAVAGLALIAAFSTAALAAFARVEDRPAAAVTFLASASGMTLFGVSGAFWGLIAGAVMLLIAPKPKS